MPPAAMRIAATAAALLAGVALAGRGLLGLAFHPRYAARSPGGVNFGWGIFEADACFNDGDFGKPGACESLRGHVRPILKYDHRANGGFAIVGGYVYRGERIPALRGRYVDGDSASKRIWIGWHEGARWHSEVLLAPPAQVKSIASFGEDETGDLYVADLGNGRIWRLDPKP